MYQNRIEHLWQQILADFADMNIGPHTKVPVKTMWLRGKKYGLTDAKEWYEVLSWACEQNLLAFTPGGICSLGNIELTEESYAMIL